jgi:Cobalamin biosynthesis protein CobN and related Mg-chelatases
MAVTDINTLDDLKAIGSGVDGNGTTLSGWTMADEYVLTTDLTIDEATWIPIGNLSDVFGGKFDGNGATIIIEGVNNAIEFTNDGVEGSGYGLFGHVNGSDVEFKNLKIVVKANVTSDGNFTGIIVGHGGNTTRLNNNISFTDCSIVFENSYSLKGDVFVGGLAGSIRNATITECSVENGLIEGQLRVGGLAGDIWGSSPTSSMVSRSYSTCDVSAKSITSGFGSYAGGLFSFIERGTISECYSTGTIHADSKFAGGLIGYVFRETIISDCYSTSSVYAYDSATIPNSGRFAGGLIGYIRHPSTSTSTLILSNCYAAGTTVYAQNNSAGGLIGSVNDSVIGTPEDAANVNIANCYSLVHTVSSPSHSGQIIGDIDDSRLPVIPSVFDSVRVWNNMTGNFNSNDSALIGAELISVSKTDVHNNFTTAGWPTFVTLPAVWKASPPNYGLPIFNITGMDDVPPMTPMYESRSNGGGGGTGSATISNNSSTNTTPSEPPVYTPPPTPSSGNDPLSENDAPSGNDTPSGSDTKKTSIWWYLILIALVIIIAGGVVYFVKFRGKDD